MKIYFLVYNIYGMGGTVRTTVNTVNYLAEHGYDVEIISLRRISEKPLFKISNKAKIRPLIDVRRDHLFNEDSSSLKNIIKKVLLRIPSILIHKDEDLYKMFNLFSDIKLVGCLLSLKSGILVTTIPSFNVMATRFLNKNIITIGQEHKPYDIHSSKIQKMIKKHYHKLDALTCVAKRDADYYKNIVDNTVFLENGIEIPVQRAKLDNKVIIAAGRFVYQKAFDTLLEAFKIVYQKHPDWKLNIFGDGEDKEMLKKIIVENDLSNNVRLMPTSNNLNEEILNSSIYALSSRYETFGMVIVEAMALGVPCVSYTTEGPTEIIKDGEDGLLVSPIDDANVFARALNSLIEDKEKRINMGINAKRNVKRYSMSAVGKKWESIIKEITDAKGINDSVRLL